MSFDIRASVLSAHVRLDSRDAVVHALSRLGVTIGAPVPVWPPRRLPFGVFVSPVRSGWVSLWPPLENTREWFPQLTATLEAPGALLEVVESEFWFVEFFRDDDFVGRVELPTEAVAWDLLRAHTEEALAAEGVLDPHKDEGRFSARMDEVAVSEAFQQDLLRMREAVPEPEDLAPFLPPHASVERAVELLTAIDRAGEEGEESSPYAEDYTEAFASYLGIRDAAWDPRADAEALSEGDYEDEEGLPEGWQHFVVLPVPQLPVLE